MSFATPWALVGLLAAGLPLLLHLVQRHQAPEVTFPAVRYLEDATRRQQRRLKFTQWVLLMVRTLLIVALVFAAAGAAVPRRVLGPHTPSALVLIVDNGPASSAIVDGEPVLVALVRAAGRVLDRAALGDRLWLLTADGIPQPGSAVELRQRLASLMPSATRFDLGTAITTAHRVLADIQRAGNIVVASALTREALSPVAGRIPVLVLRQGGALPPNRGVVGLDAGVQPWTTAGGTVTIAIVSSDTLAVPVSLAIGQRTVRDILITPGVPAVQRVGAQPPGWITITASLPPDEFRLDDSRSVAIRVAPPPEVEWDSTDRFVAAAAGVLAAAGRIRAGHDIHLGDLGPGASVLLPPADPARIGAINRALTARGSAWRFGTLIVEPARIDSSGLIPTRDSVARRYQLASAGPGGRVLATVNGEPWAVSSGNLLLVGSRFAPDWTALPLSASFVPWLDALLARAARGPLDDVELAPGALTKLPDRATAVTHAGRTTPVVGGAMWTSRAPGVFHLLAGADTLGAVAVELDPRVSDLARATDQDVRAEWPDATIAGLQQGPALAFAAGGRGDLRGALLLLAFCCVVAETVLTGRWRKRT